MIHELKFEPLYSQPRHDVDMVINMKISGQLPSARRAESKKCKRRKHNIYRKGSQSPVSERHGFEPERGKAGPETARIHEG
jgi:hypothetical protein